MQKAIETHTSPALMETSIFKRIHRACETAARERRWIAVLGEVGTGKTTIMRSCMADWMMKDKYRVIYMPGLRHRGSRVHAVMGAMLKTLVPNETHPQGAEGRFLKLVAALENQMRADRRVVLVIDNAHDLTEATVQDIKKLHEISARGHRNLFSVMFFGRSDVGRLDGLLSGSRELGYRIRRYDMMPWTEQEVFEFIGELGGRWESGERGERARGYYLQQMPRIPLAAEFTLDRLSLNPAWDGLITEDRLKMVIRASLMDMMTAYQIQYRDVIDRVESQTGKRMSKSAISSVMKGRGNVSTKAETAILDVVHDLIREKRDSTTNINPKEASHG